MSFTMRSIVQSLFFLLSFMVANAWIITPTATRSIHSSSFTMHRMIRRQATNLKMMAGPGPELDDRTKERIDLLVKSNKVLLFMKGNKLFPQCGFSNTACRILDAINTPFETVNVLEDEAIRSGIKVYSSWPTIPQLYVNGEFVGGSDIMIELYNNGELAEMIEVANAA